MIQEDYVTFEQAKLLEEKGFTQDIDRLFPDRTFIVFSDEPNNIIDYNSASIQGFLDDDYLSINGIKWYVVPTLSLVQKWLREKYDIIVQPTLYNQCYPIEYEDIIYYSDDNHYFDKTFGGVYNTYEKTLSKGINRAFELLK